MAAEDKVWLVRSHGQILGPYTIEDVEQGLKSFKFSVHDEVSEQMGYWLSFIETEAFKDISFEIQSSYVDDSKTEVSKSLSGVSVPTDVIDGSELEDFRKESNDVAAADLRARTQAVFESSDRREASKNGSFSEGVNKSSEVLIFQKSSIFGIALLLVVILGGYFLIKSRVGKGSGQAKKISLLLKEAGSSNTLGDIDRALEIAGQAYKLNPKNLETIKLYGALLVRNGDVKLATQVLNLSGLENNPEVVNLQGLAELAKNNYFLALKTFNRAIALKDDFYSARLNKGLTNLFLGQTKEALSDFKKLELEFKTFPHLFLLMAETLIKQWENTKDQNDLTQAQNLLRQNYLVDTIYNQESLIFQLYIDFLLDRSGESFGIKHRNIFDNDIFESENLIFPIDVSLYGTSWDYILGWCDNLSTALDNVMGRVLISLCRYKSKQPEMAKNLVYEILSEETESNLLYRSLLQAYLMGGQSASKKGSSVIDKLIEENNQVPIPYSMPHFLKVRKCTLSDDLKCMEKSLKPLIKLRQSSVLSQSSAAQLEFLQGRYSLSKETSMGLERMVPSYRPNKIRLLKIKQYENQKL